VASKVFAGGRTGRLPISRSLPKTEAKVADWATGTRVPPEKDREAVAGPAGSGGATATVNCRGSWQTTDLIQVRTRDAFGSDYLMVPQKPINNDG
jgi:hypothetical protein